MKKLSDTEINDKKILPHDLQTIFDSLDYEENGFLHVHAVKYLGKELHLDFSLFPPGVEEKGTQHWQLQVINDKDSKIDIHRLGNYFSFYSDQFLLWEFTDRKTDLYFKKGTDNPELLLLDIYRIHDEIFEEYIPLGKFINGHDLLELCKSNNGLFARGPKKILSYYFDCLKKAGKEPYYLGDYEPLKHDGKWLPEDKNLKLALLGGTYFIGQDFKFKKIKKVKE
jgi:hypothetical protein